MFYIRAYQTNDIEILRTIWNQIIAEGNAFAATEPLSLSEFENLLAQQTAVNCIIVDNRVAGYYILHPNNQGRLSHIANASYAIDNAFRGQKLGEKLVLHSLQQATQVGFVGMQFNAVVATNLSAIHLYLKLGFKIVGTIPSGFLLKDGQYSDMHIMFYDLNKMGS